MSRLPVLSPREVIAILQALGFEEVRQRGSHKQFRHADGRRTTLPVHGARDISPSLLRQIIKDVGIAPEDFIRHRLRAGKKGDLPPVENSSPAGV